MSNVPVALQIQFTWQESVLLGLLAMSLIICITWLIRVLVKRQILKNTPRISDRPGPIDLAIVFIGWAMLSLLLTWILKGVLQSDKLEMSLAGALGALLSCALVLALLAWKNPSRLKSLGLRLANCPRQLGYGLLTAIAIWPIATMVILPASLWLIKFLVKWVWGLNYTRQPHILIEEISSSPTAFKLALAIIMAVLVAPITEEIIFRGILQGTLVRFYRSRWAAIIASAAVFALFHLSVRENPALGETAISNVEAIPALFLLGLALGYAYEKSHSLYRPIVIHFFFNSLTMLVTWWSLSLEAIS